MLALLVLAVATRIVSLIPSLTEDLFAIGAGPQVVGISSYTTQPRAATRLPVVASLTSVDAERIVALRADLVVGVTAQAGLAAEIRKAGIRVELIPDDTLADLYTDIARLGEWTGRRAQAAALAARLHARERAVLAQVPRARTRPRAFVVLDVAPIFTVGGGSYIDALLRRAGAQNVVGDVRQAYPRISEEALLARQPDVVILTPRLDRRVLQQPPWNALRAVRRGDVWVVPEDDPLSVPGPRYVDGLAWLVARVRAWHKG